MQADYKKIDNFFFSVATGLLGKGAFASVYKAFDESKNNAEVAVKVIPATKLLEDEEQYAMFMREIDILMQIKGENIVHLLGVKRTPNNLYIFTDYCDQGDLEKYLKKNGKLSEEESLKILKQVINGFLQLGDLVIKNHKGYKVTVMHRDIKPANILFHQGEVRLADFGFAKFVDENAKDIALKHTLLGTGYYMSPQILNKEAYTFKCDIWSTGIVFYQCLFSKLPWTGGSFKGLYENIRKIPMDFPKDKPISPETKDLLQKMLQFREEDRLDWKGLWEHPAIKNFKSK